MQKQIKFIKVLDKKVSDARPITLCRGHSCRRGIAGKGQTQLQVGKDNTINIFAD